MKKLLISLLVLASPLTAFAAPISWDFNGSILQPLQSAWTALVKADRFQATSTSQASTFPYASTTAVSSSNLSSGNCVQASTGGLLTTTGSPCASSGSTFPFTPTTNFGQTANATSTQLWLQGSPISLSASSTAQFNTATATALTITGNLYNNVLTSGRVPFVTTGSLFTDTSLFTFNGTNLGVGTSSPGSLLSIGGSGTGWNFYDNATTTSNAKGINLVNGGCFAVGGTCLQTFIQNATAYKSAVSYATADLLAGTPSYSNGTGGIGATLTEVGAGALTVDGANPTVGQRVLIKDEVSQLTNGIYTVTVAGSGIASYILTRSTDYDESNDVYAGTTVPVLAGGTANADTQWTQTTTGTITIGVSTIAFQETSLGTNVVSSMKQTYGTAQTGAITLATSSDTNLLLNITNSSGTFTFTPAWTGTLAVNRGGTGAATLSGLLQGNGTGAITGISGNAGWFPYYTSTTALSATSSIFVGTNSFVGIGSTTPWAKLSIGSANATNPLVPIFAVASSSLNVGTSTLFVITGDGSVGIGTSTPGTFFSVNGVLNALSTGFITFLGEIVGKDVANVWFGRITPTRAFILAAATSTTWTGTTSPAYTPNLVMPFTGTLRTMQCLATSTGAFLNVAPFINQTPLTPTSVVASTTKGLVTFTANNTFTAGDVVSMFVGSSTASGNNLGVTCTYQVTETP